VRLRPPRLFYACGEIEMTATVAQMMRLLDDLAPPRLAESWDNVGLQIGSRHWPVMKVWTALDPLPEVVAAAVENGVDLLVTHHPLIFKPLKRIDSDSPTGRIAEMALSAKLAIFCAHTNLDSAPGGVNDILADRVGLQSLRALDKAADADLCKVVVFAPETHARAIMDAMFEKGAGRIGNYSSCSFRCEGTGSFLPGEQTSPAVGRIGALSEVPELRIEVLVHHDDVERVVAAAGKAHPYETMACDVYPLRGQDPGIGLGRVGTLPVPAALADFSKNLKAVLNLSMVKVVGSASMPVKTVALCSGSGSGLLRSAMASGADAYVSGDLSYHTARDAQQAGIAMVDIGHFGSEHIIVDALAAALGKAVEKDGISVDIEASDLETDPFVYL